MPTPNPGKTNDVPMQIDPSTIDTQPDLVASSEVLASGQRVYFRPLRGDQAAEFGFRRVGGFQARDANNYDMIAEL